MRNLKHSIKRVLQGLLRFDGYLLLFSFFKMLTLPLERSGEGEFNLFLSRLPPDGIALDVGANIGVMSVLMARRVRRGVIHAFEPIPACFRTLDRVVGYLKIKNIVTHPLALGASEGQIEMVLPEQDSVRLQGLGHVQGETGQDYPDGEHFVVPCRTLDSIPELQVDGARITAIKIDVEGFEFAVLQGAQQLISRHHPLIYCEIGLPDRPRTLDWLTAHGYRLMVAQGDRLVQYQRGIHDSRWNFFAVPPGFDETPAAASQ